MSGARAVVFDVGRVLIGYDPEAAYAARIPDLERRAAFWALRPQDWNIGFDAGESMTDGLRARAAEHPAFADEILDWRRRWTEMVGPPIQGVVALLRALKARGVPVFALTNFSAETWPVAQARFPFLTEFDLAVVSGQEGVVKPEPRIYEILETRAGFSPEALFFTDDSPANIEGARSRGWRTHLFEGADGLRAALNEVGFEV